MNRRAPRKLRVAGWAAAALLLSCTTTAGPAHPPLPVPDPSVRTGVSPAENPFVHAAGKTLVDGEGRKFVPRGLALTNGVWVRPRLPEDARTEEDYRRSQALGVNAIRIYLHYRWFEDDRRPYAYDEPGFAWLSRNLAWAKAHGIRLLLNLHVPQGGFQSAGEGRALWDAQENRARFTALWKEIARRCKDEPMLAGYDLLNEPVVSSSPAQWETLAKTTAAAIREVDQRHAIFVERLNAVIGTGRWPDWNENRNGDMNFFLLNDTNVVYEFHFYKPMQFTHQRASWVPDLVNVKTTYPGPFTDWDRTSRVGDRADLERELAPYFAFGKRRNVPLFLGEFGVIRFGFEPGRNGTGWVSDVIDLATASGVSLTYHAYHEWAFGMFQSGDDRPPEELNQPLADLFAKKYR